MTLRQRIISEIYDEKDNKIVDRQIIEDKKIETPKEIDNIGYNHGEQIAILQEIQDIFLVNQSKLLSPDSCPQCGSRVAKGGCTPSDFHSIYTDHKLQVPRVSCCNKDCSTVKITTSIYSLFGSNMHPDLVKKQTEIASEQSYLKAQAALTRENGRCRTINNQITIKKTTDKVGKILSELHQEEPDITETNHAEHLIVQVDGGYIKSYNKNHQSFEALVSSIYKPKDRIPGGRSKNGIRKSGCIKNKIYSASTLKDRGKTIKAMTIVAAKKQGMSKNTNITGLSDGAGNCWSVIKTLEKYCSSVECILDWHHIKMKFDQLINQLEDPYAGEAESLKWKVWHGKSTQTVDRLGKLYLALLGTDYADKAHDLLKYLCNNIDYLINYQLRKESMLPYTSSVIESTIETLVNTRHKKKHKAQWSREGAHNILQIRSSRASNKWGQEWAQAKQKFYIPRTKAA
ncbi:MAG: ISKra4 family transposase [Rickettsiaceae bacterium]